MSLANPSSLRIVVPFRVTLFAAAIAPTALVEVLPLTVLVPDGDKFAPGETTRLPLMAPTPASVWPLARVRVWSDRPVTSMWGTVAALPWKKITELGEMEPLPARDTSTELPSLPMEVGPV